MGDLVFSLPGPSSCSLEVRELDEDTSGRWDAFVEQCPDATFFHRAGWKKAIEDAFGHRAYYLYAESSEGIEGVLPLAHVHSLLFGNAVVSTPFCVYGGAVATSQTARVALEAAAQDLSRRLKVDYLELRNQKLYHPTWHVKDLYVTFRKAIDPEPEKNFLAIPRKQRRMVRQGIKAGLIGEIDDDVERFYEIYAISMRNLGTPVFSRKYFRTLKQVFGADCEVLTVTHAGRAVSSVMSFYFRDEVLPYYGGGTSDARALAANDFMYWELMRKASERGLRMFDYGRSKKGTGSYSFKKNWGFEPTPLYYEYFLVNARIMPDISPLNPRYRLFINGWRYMPVSLSKLVGPMIARFLG
jgi:FemAB-related protein (PEP-CTERM system-associated)